MESGYNGIVYAERTLMKLTILLFLISLNTFAGMNVAIVKLLRGDVKLLTLGKTEPLKPDQWVENGAELS